MAGKYGSANVAFLLIGGWNLLVAKFQSLAVKVRSLQEKTDGLGDAAAEYTPTGSKETTVDVAGAYFFTSAGNLHDLMANTLVAVTTASNASPSVVTTATAHRLQTGDQVQFSGMASCVPNLNRPAAVAITSSSVANPSHIVTAAPHLLANNDVVVIAGHSGSTPDINGGHVVTVVNATEFSIPVSVSGGGTGGTMLNQATKVYSATVTGPTTFTIPISVSVQGTGGSMFPYDMPGPQHVPWVTCLGFAENTIGRPFVGVEGAIAEEYEVLSQNQKLTRANVKYLASGAHENGVILHALTAETGDMNTEGATSVDHTGEDAIRAIPVVSSSVNNPTLITTTGAHHLSTGDTVLIAGHAGSTPDINGEHTITVASATTFSLDSVNVTVGGTGGTAVQGGSHLGGAAYLQVTSLTLGGYTGVTVKVRDSADDASYADLATFATVTAAPNAQRVALSATAAVARHLAIGVDFEGAGAGASMTFMVGFCRN
jgi:hypothetical protein